jgi:hypothetical protein
LGTLAFMAAFEISNTSNKEVGKSNIFGYIKDWPAGMLLLSLLAAGLVCYSIWRVIQAFATTGKEIKWPKRLRYLFSALTYLLIAYSAVQILLYNQQDSGGDQNQHWAGQILSKQYGQWLLGIGALLIAAVGVYQIYYGLSEKYKKSIQQKSGSSDIEKAFIRFGKIGYVARGIVWLIIAYLLFNAARYSSAAEAGDTSKAFQFVEGSFGSILLGLLGIGFILYGTFNFIRSRYERI